MKYFLDTEFIEGFFTSAFSSKQRHYIDLISIGIVSDNDNALYRISKEYRYSEASDWVKDHVISPMYIQTVHGDSRNRHSVDDFHLHYGKSNLGIKNDIIDFVKNDNHIQFYGYYADYDWVLFCSLFGKMIDLPEGFPRYCRDLKQMLDEKVIATRDRSIWKICDDLGGMDEDQVAQKIGSNNFYENDFKHRLAAILSTKEYPKQENEHNAIADARWNQALYHFITKI